MAQTAVSVGDPQSTISAAWQDLQSWVNGTFPGEVQGVALADMSNSAEIGVCYLQNPGGGSTGAIWEEDGNGTVSMSGLSVTSFSGASWQAATFPSASQAVFPVAFSSLVVSGNYNLNQPCAEYSTFTSKKIGSDSFTDDGSVTQSAQNGQIQFNANIDTSGPAPTLTLASVTITGSQSISLQDSSAPDNPILKALFDFIIGDNVESQVQQNMQNVFTSASFSQQLINLLNQQLGG